MKTFSFLLVLLAACLPGCITPEPVYVQGEYVFNRRVNTYTIRHQYNGKIEPYNFIVDIQNAAYSFYDDHRRWPKDKEEMLSYMIENSLKFERVDSLKLLKFMDFGKELKVEFKAIKPKHGFLYLPRPTHL